VRNKHDGPPGNGGNRSADYAVFIGNQGGDQQIGARIAYNELDLVLFFCDPSLTEGAGNVNDIARLCDQYNVPFASNVATAEVLIQGLKRGDLDWRDIVNPKH
jgi:methylglyoxal synthase